MHSELQISLAIYYVSQVRLSVTYVGFRSLLFYAHTIGYGTTRNFQQGTSLFVDMVLSKNHLSHIIITMDLGDLKFEFLKLLFFFIPMKFNPTVSII